VVAEAPDEALASWERRLTQQNARPARSRVASGISKFQKTTLKRSKWTTKAAPMAEWPVMATPAWWGVEGCQYQNPC